MKYICKAFSCLIGKDKKVTWSFGVDSHTELIDIEGYKDKDDCKRFVRIEIIPSNADYLNPDKWVLKVDNEHVPRWFSPSHKQCCYDAFKIWEGQLYKIVQRDKKIVHPFNDIKKVKPKEITSKHVCLLKKWSSVGDSVWDSVRDSVGDSVWDSVRDSVRDSVGDSVWDSVGASVRDSVRDSVWDSVWDSVGAYIGSVFKLKRNQWKHTTKIKTTGYPFQSCVDLWHMGLVPSFDGTYWRLHSGKKARVVFKIKQSALKKYKFKKLEE